MATNPLIPTDVTSKDFVHADEPQTGDARRFVVSLPIKDQTEPRASFILRYQITGTDWDPAVAQGRLAALVADRRERAETALLSAVRRTLRETNTRLVRIGDELVRVPMREA